MDNDLKKIRQKVLDKMQSKTNFKITNTPFGKVSSDLKSINHILPMKKGEILAQVIKKNVGKKEAFVWMGLVEKSEYNSILEKWCISYRPFLDQYEKFNERREQLYRKQWRDLK